MTQGFGGFILLLGSCWGYGCGAGYMAGASLGYRCVLFCLQIMMKIKILNSRKKYPKLMQKVSLM